MRRFFSKKAFTLIETLLSIAIFAAIALPLMSVFLQSIKTDRAALDVLNANYISQDYIEKLDTQTYQQILSDMPNGQKTGGYYLFARIKPYGNATSLFAGGCAYVHLVMQSSGRMLAVLPDGKWQSFYPVPGDISLALSGGQYTLDCDGTVISGAAGHSSCAVIVNAMQKASDVSPGLTLGANCKALIYCRGEDADDIRLFGTGQKHKDIIAGDTSLIHVTATVYATQSGDKTVGVSEAYISVRNE